MSYIKTNWIDGTEPYITAENLNKIEQAIYDLDSKEDSGIYIAECVITMNDSGEITTVTGTDVRLINEAYNNGKTIILKGSFEDEPSLNIIFSLIHRQTTTDIYQFTFNMLQMDDSIAGLYEIYGVCNDTTYDWYGTTKILYGVPEITESKNNAILQAYYTASGTEIGTTWKSLSTSLSASSKNTEIPSAKAVYDAIQTGGGGNTNVMVVTYDGTTGSKTYAEMLQAKQAGKAIILIYSDSGNTFTLKSFQDNEAIFEYTNYNYTSSNALTTLDRVVITINSDNIWTENTFYARLVPGYIDGVTTGDMLTYTGTGPVWSKNSQNIFSCAYGGDDGILYGFLQNIGYNDWEGEGYIRYTDKTGFCIDPNTYTPCWVTQGYYDVSSEASSATFIGTSYDNSDNKPIMIKITASTSYEYDPRWTRTVINI